MGITYIYNKCYGQRIMLVASMLLLIYVRPLYADSPVYKDVMTQPPVTFFAGNQDIPVMPGLTEVEGRSFSYDKPEGEITELVAVVEGLSAEQVLYYYDVTLPQFGWNKIIEAEGGHFYRKGEYLDFSFDTEEAQSLVKIMIHPSR